MSESEAECWQEWKPLTPLLDQLPHHFQRGLSTSQLHLTCLAALPQHLLLGTNVGLVYLAHLPSLNLMRLKCENPGEGISCVAGVRTVEDMVAVGGTQGAVTIFQLPRVDVAVKHSSGGVVTHPPVKRFSVTTTHTTRITALAWSLNGLMLFSGDEGGCVGMVEVDPTRCECTARLLHVEPSPITQLSYLHQRLAVCTRERALVYMPADGTHLQVGHRARRHPGVFGCVWSPSAPRKTGLLFTARPGLRLWAAEGAGEVLHTHIIRDLPSGAESVLLNPAAEAPREGEHFSFGLLHTLGADTVVSHTPHWLIAFDTQRRRILAFTGRFRHIAGLAVCDRQIFVLDGSRTVVCLSPQPPQHIGSCRVPRSPALGLWELSQLGSKLVTQGSDLMDHLARVGSSMAARVTEHAAPPVLTGRKGVVGGARRGEGVWGVEEKGRESGEEGLSGQAEKVCAYASLVSVLHGSPSPTPSPTPSPPLQVTPPPLLHPTHTNATNNNNNNNEVGSVEVEKVEEVVEVLGGGDGGGDSLESCGPLVTRGRTRKKRTRKNASTHSPDTQSDTSPSPNPSTLTVTPHHPYPPNQHHSPSSKDIKTNIQEKELLLANILDMDCLKLDHPAPPEPPQSLYPLSQAPETLPWGSEGLESPGDTQCSTPSTVKETSPAPSSVGGGEDFYARLFQRHLSLSSGESGDGPPCLPRVRGREEEEEEEDPERLHSNLSEDHSSCLSYGPPSGSSLPPHLPVACPPTPQPPPPLPRQVVTLNDSSDIADITWSYPQEEEEEEEEEEVEEEEVLCGGWVRRSLPGCAVSLATSLTCRAFVNTSGHLYLAGSQAGDPWRKVTLTRRALQVSLAPGGSLGWVVVEGGEAFAFVPPPTDAPSPAPPTKMAAVAKNVHQASVGDERTWYLDTHMQVCVCPSVMEEATPTHVPGGGSGGEAQQVVQVVTRGQVVWALTHSGQLLFRIGVSQGTATAHYNNNSGGAKGQEWGTMAGPNAVHGSPVAPVVGVALGVGDRGWVVDARGRLFFREGVCDEFPQGEDLRWWQVVVSSYMVGDELGVGEVLLAAAHHGLCLTELAAHTCCIHGPLITGHCWDVFNEEVWSVVCAEGLYTTQGALCCLSPLGQLFLTNPNTASYVPLEPPPVSKDRGDSSVVVSVSQRPEVLWVVTADGRVFIRAGLSASSLLGSHWDELDLTQIGDVQLCHISCGTEVVWGVDTKGGVYMRQGPLTPCHTQSLPPAWIQVEPSVGTEVEFTKVYVGARLHLVWALDSCLRVYVRQAIYPELPVGLSWVLVPGLVATHLSISEDQVVALTPHGEVFRRTGVSANNFIGDTWECIPGRLAGLSVTTDNTLWGLNPSGYLCKHSSRDVDLNAATNTTTTSAAPLLRSLSLPSEPEDWEVL